MQEIDKLPLEYPPREALTEYAERFGILLIVALVSIFAFAVAFIIISLPIVIWGAILVGIISGVVIRMVTRRVLPTSSKSDIHLLRANNLAYKTKNRYKLTRNSYSNRVLELATGIKMKQSPPMLVGAAIGTIVPVIGTAIGGTIGSATGLFGLLEAETRAQTNTATSIVDDKSVNLEDIGKGISILVKMQDMPRFQEWLHYMREKAEDNPITYQQIAEYLSTSEDQVVTEDAVERSFARLRRRFIKLLEEEEHQKEIS